MLELDIPTAHPIAELRLRVSAEWHLDERSFRLLAGTCVLDDDAIIASIAAGPGGTVDVQLVKFDPLPKLGLFDQANHRGIMVNPWQNGYATLTKTSEVPDSNNVFLCHPVHEPCFVEFYIFRAADEMSIGVTYEREAVQKVSGFANLHLTSTWLYSKKKAMPTTLFAGASKSDAPAFNEGDCVAVFADPEQRLVKFYLNGTCVASNSESPLPAYDGRPLGIYVMVDMQGDKVEILQFGPGEPSRFADKDGDFFRTSLNSMLE